MADIYAFSDINIQLCNRIKNINSKLVFCGGINFWKDRTGDTFSIFKNIKSTKRDDFIILLSPTDVFFFQTILNLLFFIKNSKKVLKHTYQKEDIPRPSNILNFKDEYDKYIDRNKLRNLVFGKNVEFSGRDLSILNTIVKYLEELNPFVFLDIKYILLNSQIVYETEKYVFIPEHGRLNYTCFDDFNEKYKRGIEYMINNQSDDFIQIYMQKHKKITLPFIDKKYIVGNSKKSCDFPYYRDNAIYINCSVGSSCYLENGIIEKYSRQAWCIIKITEELINYECSTCKGEKIEDIIREDYENIENFQVTEDERTKDIATRVSEEYYTIETKNMFLICKRQEFTIKQVEILDLVELSRQGLEKYKKFIKNEHKNIEELSRKYTSILKKESEGDSIKSDKSGRRVSFSEIFEVILDSSDDDH